MTAIVLGAGGQVGRALIESGAAFLRGYDHAACDICDESSVACALDKPDVSLVINCAAYTAVDRAETERAAAFAINSEGAALVATAAMKRGIPVIHLSTDYVYAGKGDKPFREDEPLSPLSIYGASKAAGDAAIAAANPRHVLLRVSWVFGRYGANFVKTMRRLGCERSELRIVNDQVGGPTEARDIAMAIIAIAGAIGSDRFDQWGVYHFAGAPVSSWYGFAQEIFCALPGPGPRLVPISTAEYPTAARRPLNSRLSCEKIAKVFGISQPDWRTSLRRVLNDLEAGIN